MKITSLPDGEYDTCPLHGPKVYMPDRRIVVKDNICRLKNDVVSPSKGAFGADRFTFTVEYFFEVNVLFENPG